MAAPASVPAPIVIQISTGLPSRLRAIAHQTTTAVTRVAENIDNESVIEEVGKESLLLCSQFPVPDHFIIPNRNNSR